MNDLKELYEVGLSCIGVESAFTTKDWIEMIGGLVAMPIALASFAISWVIYKRETPTLRV